VYTTNKLVNQVWPIGASKTAYNTINTEHHIPTDHSGVYMKKRKNSSITYDKNSYLHPKKQPITPNNNTFTFEITKRKEDPNPTSTRKMQNKNHIMQLWQFF
jgi:hypothetical protein